MVTLAQREDGFRYTSDSLFLVDFISKFPVKGKVLDVGCGCGIVGILVAKHHPHTTMSMVDIDPVNCEIARSNGKNNGLCIDVYEGDFLTLPTGDIFDLIVSNPPYYPANTTQSENPHKACSRYENFLPLEELFSQVKKQLSPQGEFVMCHHPYALSRILSDRSLKATHLQFVHPTAQKEASLVLVRLKKGSNSPCNILPPLIAMDEGKPTLQAKAIFESYPTQSATWNF